MSDREIGQRSVNGNKLPHKKELYNYNIRTIYGLRVGNPVEYVLNNDPRGSKINVARESRQLARLPLLRANVGQVKAKIFQYNPALSVPPTL